MFPFVRERTREEKLIFSTHLHNKWFYEQVKLEFLDKCKEEGLTKSNEIKVIGVYFPKNNPETGGYSIEKNVTICLLPNDTWTIIIHQLICEDVFFSEKRYFKHRIHSMNFGVTPEYCIHNTIKLDSKKSPYNTLPDNSKLYIHQIMFKKGEKVVPKTLYKCKCIKCYPGLICCND